jgi:YbbR domain-containing protein
MKEIKDGIISLNSDRITINIEPKVTFINELKIGDMKVPVRTELDFSSIDKSYHEEVLKIAEGIYHKDAEIK